eukprot:UN02705
MFLFGVLFLGLFVNNDASKGTQATLAYRDAFNSLKSTDSLDMKDAVNQIERLKGRVEFLSIYRSELINLMYSSILSSDMSPKSIFSISFLPSIPLIATNESYVRKFESWRNLKRKITSALLRYLNSFPVPNAFPLSTYVFPTRVGSEMQYTLIVMVSNEDLIPKISEFITSSENFKCLMNSLNCTEYQITGATIKSIHDLGSDAAWTLVEKQ